MKIKGIRDSIITGLSTTFLLWLFTKSAMYVKNIDLMNHLLLMGGFITSFLYALYVSTIVSINMNKCKKLKLQMNEVSKSFNDIIVEKKESDIEHKSIRAESRIINSKIKAVNEENLKLKKIIRIVEYEYKIKLPVL